MADNNQNVVFNGLGTLSNKILSAGLYFVEGKISLPTITNGGGASSLLVVVNQNGSPIYTGKVGADGFKTEVNALANDLLTIVFSSSSPADQVLNGIKSVVSFGLVE
jgi:hypothetical protein